MVTHTESKGRKEAEKEEEGGRERGGGRRERGGGRRERGGGQQKERERRERSLSAQTAAPRSIFDYHIIETVFTEMCVFACVHVCVFMCVCVCVCVSGPTTVHSDSATSHVWRIYCRT